MAQADRAGALRAGRALRPFGAGDRLRPIPFEAVLAPYMQMRRDIMWRLAAIGLAGFLTATVLGYAVGALVLEAVGGPFLAMMGWEAQFAEAQARLRGRGFIALAILVALPMPTQAVMIGAGAVGIPLGAVIAAAVLVRGTRYFGAALLVYRFGDPVVAWFAAKAGRRDQPPR